MSAAAAELPTREQLNETLGLARWHDDIVRAGAIVGLPGQHLIDARERWNSGWHRLWLAACADIPQRYWRASLDGEVTAAIRHVKAFIGSDGPTPNGPRACVLLGPTGVGKTHSAAAAMIELGEWDWRRRHWYSVPRLVRELMTSTSRDAVMERITTARAIVLDDLGVEYHREGGGFADALLDELIAELEAADRVVVFMTSNLTLVRLAATLGDRVADRLSGSWATIAEVPGQSLRGRS